MQSKLYSALQAYFDYLPVEDEGNTGEYLRISKGIEHLLRASVLFVLSEACATAAALDGRFDGFAQFNRAVRDNKRSEYQIAIQRLIELARLSGPPTRLLTAERLRSSFDVTLLRDMEKLFLQRNNLSHETGSEIDLTHLPFWRGVLKRTLECHKVFTDQLHFTLVESQAYDIPVYPFGSIGVLRFRYGKGRERVLAPLILGYRRTHSDALTIVLPYLTDAYSDCIRCKFTGLGRHQSHQVNYPRSLELPRALFDGIPKTWLPKASSLGPYEISKTYWQSESTTFTLDRDIHERFVGREHIIEAITSSLLRPLGKGKAICVSADMGTGKSWLLRKLYHTLADRGGGEHSDIAIAYYKIREGDRSSANGIVKSLCAQLVWHWDLPRFEKMFSRPDPLALAHNILSASMRKLPRLAIALVDGLDELVADERKYLLNTLRDLLDEHPGHLRVLVSTRKDNVVHDTLRPDILINESVLNSWEDSLALAESRVGPINSPQLIRRDVIHKITSVANDTLQFVELLARWVEDSRPQTVQDLELMPRTIFEAVYLDLDNRVRHPNSPAQWRSACQILSTCTLLRNSIDLSKLNRITKIDSFALRTTLPNLSYYLEIRQDGGAITIDHTTAATAKAEAEIVWRHKAFADAILEYPLAQDDVERSARQILVLPDVDGMSLEDIKRILRYGGFNRELAVCLGRSAFVNKIAGHYETIFQSLCIIDSWRSLHEAWFDFLRLLAQQDQTACLTHARPHESLWLRLARPSMKITLECWKRSKGSRLDLLIEHLPAVRTHFVEYERLLQVCRRTLIYDSDLSQLNRTLIDLTNHISQHQDILHRDILNEPDGFYEFLYLMTTKGRLTKPELVALARDNLQSLIELALHSESSSVVETIVYSHEFVSVMDALDLPHRQQIARLLTASWDEVVHQCISYLRECLEQFDEENDLGFLEDLDGELPPIEQSNNNEYSRDSEQIEELRRSAEDYQDWTRECMHWVFNPYRFPHRVYHRFQELEQFGVPAEDVSMLMTELREAARVAFAPLSSFKYIFEDFDRYWIEYVLRQDEQEYAGGEAENESIYLGPIPFVVGEHIGNADTLKSRFDSGCFSAKSMLTTTPMSLECAFLLSALLSSFYKRFEGFLLPRIDPRDRTQTTQYAALFYRFVAGQEQSLIPQQTQTNEVWDCRNGWTFLILYCQSEVEKCLELIRSKLLDTDSDRDRSLKLLDGFVEALDSLDRQIREKWMPVYSEFFPEFIHQSQLPDIPDCLTYLFRADDKEFRRFLDTHYRSSSGAVSGGDLLDPSAEPLISETLELCATREGRASINIQVLLNKLERTVIT